MGSLLDSKDMIWQTPTHAAIWKLMLSFVEAGSIVGSGAVNIEATKKSLSEELTLFKDGFKTHVLNPAQKLLLDSLGSVLMHKISKVASEEDLNNAIQVGKTLVSKPVVECLIVAAC
jgi:hypothetical protein